MWERAAAKQGPVWLSPPEYASECLSELLKLRGRENMAINLTNNRDALVAAWKSVVDDKSATNWQVSFLFERKKKKKKISPPPAICERARVLIRERDRSERRVEFSFSRNCYFMSSCACNQRAARQLHYFTWLLSSRPIYCFPRGLEIGACEMFLFEKAFAQCFREFH